MTFRIGLILGFLALCGCSSPSPAQSSAGKATVGKADAAKGAAAATQTAKRDTADPLASRAMGSPTAPITVYEMSDFQCPFCRRHALETWPAIEREYVATGKVRWVFLNYPLTSLHPNAAAAAQFAMCAADAGKFWPVHDLLYRHQDTWAPLKDPAPFLMTLADSVGIPRTRMLACLQSPRARETVEADADGAARAGATSTPSFYVEGGMIVGAYPITVFRQVLDSIYRVKTGK
jgi:protein-disulfide isomerase